MKEIIKGLLIVVILAGLFIAAQLASNYVHYGTFLFK